MHVLKWQNTKKALFIYYGHANDLSSKSSGSARIQYEIARSYSNKVIPHALLSSMSKLFTSFITTSKKKLSHNASVSKFKWILTNIIWIIQHFLTHPLFLNKKTVIELSQYDTVILGSILGASFIRKFVKSRLIVLDHNVSWLFTYHTIERIPIIWRILVALIRKIELDAVNVADEIWMLTEHDAQILREDVKNPSKIRVIPPWELSRRYSREEVEYIIEKSKTLSIYHELREKFVIGFLGTLFEPNIIAVKNIIKMASKLQNNVVFLVIGSVNEAFKKEKTPPNVIFTGYVKDLDPYLALCDAFINIKITPQTGAEIKMLDYLKFDKPIISTSMGVHGFEHCKNIIIADTIDDMLNEIRRLIEGCKRFP
jgi:glycosyltransferase involved in cell wall biosynthesis